MNQAGSSPIDDDELRDALVRRVGRATLAAPETDRLLLAIMAGVAASPRVTPRRSRPAWWSLAASFAGLAVVAVAVTALLSGLPAPVAVGPSAPPPATAGPSTYVPTHVLTSAELNGLLDRHASGEVLADITMTLIPPDASGTLCSLAERCLPRVGTIDRGLDGLRSMVVVDPWFPGEIEGDEVSRVAALHLDGTDQVELLGFIDQGMPEITPLAASLPGLPARPHDHGEEAIVVEGWLVGEASMPHWTVPTSFLVADVDAPQRPADAIPLARGTFSAWTVRQDRTTGAPDRGLYVLRSSRAAATTASDPDWTVVGRLTGVTLPAPLSTVRVDDWTATCLTVSEEVCRGAASRFIGNQGRGGQALFEASGGIVHVTPRSACPRTTQPLRWKTCFQVTVTVDQATLCMIVARDASGVFGQVGGPIPGRAGPVPDGWPMCD